MSNPFFGSFGPVAYFGVTGSGLPFSFRENRVDASNLTTYSYAACDLGAPAFDRLIIVAAATSGTHSVSSMTIGGISASLVVTSGSTSRAVEIWSAVVPTGGTGTISVTWDGLCIESGIGIWAGYPDSTVPIDALGSSSASASTLTLADLAKTSSGFVVLAASHSSAAQRLTFTQNGVEGITENYDQTLATIAYAGGSFVVTASDSTNDFTATWGGGAQVGLVGASWV